MSLNVAFSMGEDVFARIFPPRRRAHLGPSLPVLADEPLTTFSSPLADAVLPEVEVLITGWGAPMVDDAVLDRAPNLRYVIHAGGSVKHHLDAACWARGIEVSTAATANAIPVAEYTVAAILMANKKVLQLNAALKSTRGHINPDAMFPEMGNFEKRVGLVGASRIGRHVIELLKPFALEVVVADPYLDADAARDLGVTLMELDELASTSDVISLHAPSLPSTHNLISERVIGLMKPGATFINTARGELVDQDALIRRLCKQDLYAILDVTTPWDLPADNQLYDLPNVLLTPHAAGSLGTELQRLAVTAIEEANRVAGGGELVHRVAVEDLLLMA
ncbi:hydroxyacid dehydrogenase [Arthrobacter tecti]